ncbi:alpha/beta hydrolase [Yeosuana sp. MJ-SS3]|uniref:Alpha/beta hydrolase n=1 Tax=Gilvirhabdus luticola TaxID=3079858 RepID=A0ABU3U5L2_9FLAO|nr:alpha/beta hydrolase [Yeosuana sp. MJ-SS3]MDU8885612.1 alpha/beta hydrolase [Yeosuana sp. MJ-SS3]
MSFIPQREKPKLKKVIIIFVIMYLGIASTLYFLQDNILFRPTVLAKDFEYKFSYPFEELFLNPEEGVVINALHFTNIKPKGVILYFHGNAGDLSRWGKIMEYFVQLNYDVLVMDYRTYGKSTGALSQEGLYRDAQFCYDYLKKSYPEEYITVYGRSLGTTFAAFVASKNNPKQIILETPYYSMSDVAKLRFPLLPTKYLLKYKLPTYSFMNKIDCNILILHGSEDKVIKISSAEKLFEVAPENQTTFIAIEGASHNDLINFEEYHNAIKDLLLQ